MAFGELLKKKRLERGWTKEYVVERTHLMAKQIDDLETESFKHIPSEFYGQGFIRIYCDLLELDPKPLVDDYLTLVGRNERAKVVTRPMVHDLPEHPIEPIHTGARRTLPPKDIPLPTAEHTLVESAEASFTAVPKPEFASEPIPLGQNDAFHLSSDDLPQNMLSGVDGSISGARSKLAEPESRTFNRVKTQEISLELNYDGHSSRNKTIFGPQHPISESQNLQFEFFIEALKGIAGGLLSCLRALSHPKIQRVSKTSKLWLDQRILLRVLVAILLLIFLSGLLFIFRYVFRMSADAETEAGLTAQPISARQEPTILQPPVPYFR